MATDIEYALMAGASYISTRPDINKFPVPQGWVAVTNPPYFKDDTTGFEAIAFTNGTEIVISFAGTYEKSAADWLANASLGLVDHYTHALSTSSFSARSDDEYSWLNKVARREST